MNPLRFKIGNDEIALFKPKIDILVAASTGITKSEIITSKTHITYVINFESDEHNLLFTKSLSENKIHFKGTVGL